MKMLYICVIISAVLLVLIAGCTNQAETKPLTPAPTVLPTTVATVIPTEITPIQTSTTDGSLPGTWYLRLMSEQNGTTLVQAISPETTLVFEGDVNISGYSGCNNYMGRYTLTGKTEPNGKGIAISPLVSTKKNCADSSTTETTYLQILQASKEYLVNEKQELSIMDNSGNTLVYQKTPYSATAVPIGS